MIVALSAHNGENFKKQALESMMDYYGKYFNLYMFRIKTNKCKEDLVHLVEIQFIMILIGFLS